MALQSSVTLSNGVSGNYIRITGFWWDRLAKEASAHFCLYASQSYANSAPDMPLCLVAKLRLNGDKFDQYLSSDALAALENPGQDPIRDQLYSASKVEALQPGGGLTRDDVLFAFAHATDV